MKTKPEITVVIIGLILTAFAFLIALGAIDGHAVIAINPRPIGIAGAFLMLAGFLANIKNWNLK